MPVAGQASVRGSGAHCPVGSSPPLRSKVLACNRPVGVEPRLALCHSSAEEGAKPVMGESAMDCIATEKFALLNPL